MTYLSQEFLVVFQIVFPAFLFILLLSAFIERINRASNPSSTEYAEIVPVIIPVLRVRSKLISTLLALFTLTFVLSLTLLLVYYHGKPPVLVVWFSASNLIVWGTATSLVWFRRNRTASEFTWAKTVSWVGLIGTVLIGSERISQFVQETKDPQTTFPLPFFLLLSIYSVRLLLLILILWALHNPAQDFVPAARRSTANVSTHASFGENAPLMNSERDHSDIEEQAVQEEGISYGTFANAPESAQRSILVVEHKTSAESSVEDSTVIGAEGDESDTPKRSVSSVVEDDEQALSKPLVARETTDAIVQTSSLSGEIAPLVSTRPFSYTEAVTHSANEADVGQDIKASSDLTDTTKTTGTHEKSASASPKPSSSPRGSSAMSDAAVSLPPSKESAKTPESKPIESPTSVIGQPVNSDIVFPTSTSPVSSFDLQSRTLEESPRLSTDSTDFSPNGGGKEKSKKKITTLADVGRRVSNESNKFVRRISLINKSKSASSPGGSANASPSKSPLSLPQELDPIEPSELDTAQGEEAGHGSAPGSPIAKRFALLTRKSSSASSTGRIPPGLQDQSAQGLMSPGLNEATGQMPSPNASISGSGSGSGSKKKKKKNGKNSKGKKATKNKK